MSSLEDFMEFVNYSRRYREVCPRRYLRDYSNPFEKYSVREFHSRYRFMPNNVKNTLIPMLENHLRKPSKRGLSFPPEIMVLITLRYFATGCFQKLDGDVMDICQQSVSPIIAKVSTLIGGKLKDFVKFPASPEETNIVKQNFYDVAHFPGVIGCIDCTHIKIRSPGGMSSEVFRNRKGWFSINIQAVTGPNLEFFDLVVVRWPGSTHDSFIYNSSSVKSSPVSPVVADIFMENFEEMALANSPVVPRFYKRYVDDTFTILPSDKITVFLNHLNSIHPKIKFTKELEYKNSLPFLDVLVSHNSDNTLSHTVYRNETYTNRYLNGESNHPLS